MPTLGGEVAGDDGGGEGGRGATSDEAAAMRRGFRCESSSKGKAHSAPNATRIVDAASFYR